MIGLVLCVGVCEGVRDGVWRHAVKKRLEHNRICLLYCLLGSSGSVVFSSQLGFQV